MEQIVITGGGPTGLSAGIFLAQKGIKPRIFEKKPGLSENSKALGVNARTLSLLEGTGVTERFLENGWKLEGMNVWQKGKVIFHNDLSKQNVKYPFMLIQPQSESERILEEVLVDKGVVVEHGKEVNDLNPKSESVEVFFTNEPNPLETACYFAADGANSTSRRSLGIPYKGSDMDGTWSIYDLELDIPLNPNEGHIILFKKGAMALIRIKKNIWRIAGNLPGLLEHLPKGTVTGRIVWQSDFSISNRIVENFQTGQVFFGGDAAHIHSPLGARGMNLGIEDAYIFTEMYYKGRQDKYHELRKPVVEDIVHKVRDMTSLVRGKSLMAKSVRMIAPVMGFFSPIMENQLARFVMGLDHEVDQHYLRPNKTFASRN